MKYSVHEMLYFQKYLPCALNIFPRNKRVFIELNTHIIPQT